MNRTPASTGRGQGTVGANESGQQPASSARGRGRGARGRGVARARGEAAVGRGRGVGITPLMSDREVEAAGGVGEGRVRKRSHPEGDASGRGAAKRQREEAPGVVAVDVPVETVAEVVRETMGANALHTILVHGIKLTNILSVEEISTVLLNPEADVIVFNAMLDRVLSRLDQDLEQQRIRWVGIRWTRGAENVDDKILEFVSAIRNQATVSKWDQANKVLAARIMKAVGLKHKDIILTETLKLVDSVEMARIIKDMYLWNYRWFLSKNAQVRLSEGLNVYLPEGEKLQ